jgi:hypothetical protein
MKTSFKGPIISRTRQGLQEASQRQEKKCKFKIRERICYSCRLKGHLSQDCPNGNKHEPKVVNSAPTMHGNSNGLYDKDPMRLGYQNLPKISCRWLEMH